MSDSIAPLLEVQHVTKDYPGVRALDNVSFQVRAGEVHCLAGENGAGKSTLIEIIGGSYGKDSGKFFSRAKNTYSSARNTHRNAASRFCIRNCPILRDLSVAENIFLGRQPRSALGVITYSEMNRRARHWLGMIQADIDPRLPLGRLSVSKQQLVSIAKAISLEASVIIFDEPSAVLTTAELARLFEIIRAFKAEGRGIVYISHRLEEIFEIGDRVTVLRNGKLVGTENIKDINRDVLVRMLVGRDVSEEYSQPPVRTDKDAAPVLEIRHLKRDGVLHDINISVSRGEIFGIYGLVGAGRSEVARAIIGADRIDGGEILLAGKKLRIRSPRDAIRNGICLAPEDRKSQGVLLEKSLAENIALPSLKRMRGFLFLDHAKMFRYSSDFVHSLKIATPSVNQLVRFLSGGNQQKVVLAKWFGMNLEVFIFDEPTRGIDVGAKEEIQVDDPQSCRRRQGGHSHFLRNPGNPEHQ